MEDSDTLPTISGNEVIMAYSHAPKTHVQHSRDKQCTSFFWSRYALFVINFLVWVAGITMVGLGAWTHAEGSGLRIFASLLTEPSILLIATGVAMVLVGIFGCVGSLRLNILCLRIFMVFVVVVFILQLVLGAVIFFLLDDVEERMLRTIKSSITGYRQGDDTKEDEELDYLQREHNCCGGSSPSDWDANIYYNCSSLTASACGVPNSCCRVKQDNQCGFGVRRATEEYTKMFIHTSGCVVSLMNVFKDNIIIIASISFAICLLEMLSLLFANLIVRYTVYHKKLTV